MGTGAGRPERGRSHPRHPRVEQHPVDVQHVLQAQDDYDKLLVNWRSSEEFVGFPTWATDGMLDENTPVSVGPNKIMSGGNWSVLQTPGIEPFVERRQVILDDAAKLSSSIKLAQESARP